MADLGLNLGCGPRMITECNGITFLNVDYDIKYQRVARMENAHFKLHDLTNLPLPFKDSSFKTINISQCLEHLHLVDALNLLLECNRISCGLIRITVPDAKLLFDKYLNKEMNDFNCVQPPIYSVMKSEMTKFGLILFGALHEHGEYAHKQCYDEEGLQEVMEMAGFKNITKVDYDSCLDAELAQNHQLAMIGEK